MTASFAAYALVGALGALVHYSVTVAAVELLAWNVLVASAAGFVAALCTQFVINRRYVFASAAPVAASFARYAATSVMGLCLNLAVLHAATAFAGLHYLVGAALAIAVVTPVNFALNRRWTFRT